jgi:hypothetical protein
VVLSAPAFLLFGFVCMAIAGIVGERLLRRAASRAAP